ncbi:PepSY domain-containing protein [bacterium]|nr:PepSY domain-containing protein [bacterium]
MFPSEPVPSQLENVSPASGSKSSADEITPVAGPTRNRLFTAMWRWHFYAGLLAVPICIFLGVTGGIYLFKPVVEPWLYQELQTVEPGNVRLPAEQQLAAVRQAFPESKPDSITVGVDPTDATEVGLRDKVGRNLLVYVNPYSGEVTGSLVRDQMLMQQVRNLHGELMMGAFGSAFVELTACWTIILLMTGLYLWWPRSGLRVMGVFVPRMRQGARTFWRDLHAVVGMYSAAVVIVLLVTGLPWTNIWGGLFKRVQQATGQARPVAADFRVPYRSERLDGAIALTLPAALKIAAEQGVAEGSTVKLPRGQEGTYGFINRARNLEDSDFLYLDQYSGKVLARANWDDHPVSAKAVALGIRLHQGELFGPVNLVAMLLGALATVWMSVTGVVMWWQRRPQGKLGVPELPANWNIPRAIAVVTIGLGVFFPLVGVSLIFVWVLERFFLSRLPRASAWLELTTR